MKNRFDKIKQATIKKPYLYSFIIIVLVYLSLNIIVNQVYVTLPLLFTYNLKIIIPFLFLTILTALLIATNINLIYIKFKELKDVNKAGSLSFFGIFGGLLGGACPSCFVGLFPALLGLFGVTASLSSLPFFGLEILVGSAALLLISIYLLTKDNVCKINLE
ncbi:hypothetical protein HYV89_01585 [Candidatus Woesearchaeota archaeon]|nr:hypothetical protein [Candidatus Woesearchaeota archaeon]